MAETLQKIIEKLRLVSIFAKKSHFRPVFFIFEQLAYTSPFSGRKLSLKHEGGSDHGEHGYQKRQGGDVCRMQ